MPTKKILAVFTHCFLIFSLLQSPIFFSAEILTAEASNFFDLSGDIAPEAKTKVKKTNQISPLNKLKIAETKTETIKWLIGAMACPSQSCYWYSWLSD